MPWFSKDKEGGNESQISDGGDFQCDCPVGNCPCSRWGPWIPKGRPVPCTVQCDQCQAGNHSG